jgi:hypothetical protein
LNVDLVEVPVPLVDFIRLARDFQSRAETAVSDDFSNILLVPDRLFVFHTTASFSAIEYILGQVSAIVEIKSTIIQALFRRVPGVTSQLVSDGDESFGFEFTDRLISGRLHRGNAVHCTTCATCYHASGRIRDRAATCCT